MKLYMNRQSQEVQKKPKVLNTNVNELRPVTSERTKTKNEYFNRKPVIETVERNPSVNSNTNIKAISSQLNLRSSLLQRGNMGTSFSKGCLDKPMDSKVNTEFGSALMRRLMYKGNRFTANTVTYKAIAQVVSSLKSSIRQDENRITGTTTGQSLVNKSKLARDTGTNRQRKLEVLNNSIKRYLPYIEIKTQLRRGSAIRIPKPINSSRQKSLLIRWIVESARARSRTSSTANQQLSFIDKLTKELQDILNSNSACGTAKKQAEMHKIAEANRGNIR